MKNAILPLLLLCGMATVSAQVTKVKDAGADATRINFTVIGDGYQAAETAKFTTDVNSAMTDFFNEAPFSNYTNFFNVHAIFVASAESGADHPSTDGGAGHPELEVNTAFDASFHWGGSSHRLLYANTAKVNAAVAANYPASDQELVIINTPFYGGGGGGFAAFSTAAAASDLALHESGHSYMSLADEYAGGGAGERANNTSVANAGNVRWSDWIGTNDIGEFDNGGWIKCANGTCMMESLNQPFCSVCQEQTIETIYGDVSPLESTSPAMADVVFDGTDLDFSITTIKPIPNTLTYIWTLDGNQIAVGTEEVTLDAADLTQPDMTLRATVTDETGLSLKNANYVFTYEWTIMNQLLPLEWVAFTATGDGKLNRLDWEIAEPDGSSHFLIERSGANNDWETIGREAFTGVATYVFYDESPLAGDNNYRLRAVDFDATTTMSPIRVVRGVRRNFFKVYPSVTDGPVSYEVFSEDNGEVAVQVISADGRVVLSRKTTSAAGWLRDWIDLSSLAAGAYTVRVETRKVAHTERVVRR